jgi:hypothetical protein
MPRYAKQPLEEKLTWMRERQKEREERAARQGEQEEARRRQERLEQSAERVARAAPGLLERPSRRMLRVHEVAEILRCSSRTVGRWFAGRAVIVRTGPRKTHMLISEQILDDWIAEHTATPQARR